MSEVSIEAAGREDPKLSTLFYLSFMIEITDEETSDLLSHLDEAVQFIEGFDSETLNTKI